MPSSAATARARSTSRDAIATSSTCSHLRSAGMTFVRASFEVVRTPHLTRAIDSRLARGERLPGAADVRLGGADARDRDAQCDPAVEAGVREKDLAAGIHALQEVGVER